VDQQPQGWFISEKRLFDGIHPQPIKRLGSYATKNDKIEIRSINHITKQSKI